MLSWHCATHTVLGSTVTIKICHDAVVTSAKNIYLGQLDCAVTCTARTVQRSEWCAVLWYEHRDSLWPSRPWSPLFGRRAGTAKANSGRCREGSSRQSRAAASVDWGGAKSRPCWASWMTVRARAVHRSSRQMRRRGVGRPSSRMLLLWAACMRATRHNTVSESPHA